MIRRLPIANRREITVRIIRTYKEMNTETIAVYSTADKEALYVQLVDYAVCIGGPRANDSYLNMKNTLSVACMTACDATHPSFGFSSGNTRFARLVLQCGLIFVGPNPDVVEQMGNRNNARHCVMEAGVSVIPGSKDLLKTVQGAATVTERVGHPMLIKTSSGGDGCEMRRADCTGELADAFDAAKMKARANFGDDVVYTEKFVVELKHVEVQLMTDKHGNATHLYERDCSYQRHNQELLEEAPYYILEEDVHGHLFRDTVRAAESIGYDSVGIIESLLDARGEYYFMEMNTRIQVEHTISEEIYGINLVKQQIRVADGHRLVYRQENIICRDHAIECRINAENIEYNFAPSLGQVNSINFPLGRRVCVESAVYDDYSIPPYYNSMTAKIITYVDTRLECIKRMRSVLEELLIEGVETNAELQYLLLYYPAFIGGRYDTGLMEPFIKGLEGGGVII